MEPLSTQEAFLKEMQEAYAELAELDARWSELGLEMAANRERHAQVQKIIRSLSVIIRNAGATEGFSFHHAVSPNVQIESVHMQIRREIMLRPNGVSRADLKGFFGWVNDKTLDNVIFRLCRSGEIQKDKNRRGYYLPGKDTQINTNTE